MSTKLFSLESKVSIVTGSEGVLGGSISTSLVKAGVKVALFRYPPETVGSKEGGATKYRR